MKQATALIWKEWRQGRVFFFIALLIFLVFPVLGEAEFHHGWNLHRFEIQTSPWVIACVGIFAVFTAIGMTCPDFRGRLSDFWRSRPLEMRAWLGIKYLVGLLIVLAPCIAALALELMTCQDKSASNQLYLGPFQWTAIYSMAFAIGCTIRRAAPAAMLSLGAMLLIYFLPLVLPPLSWLDYQKVSYLYTDFHTPTFVFGREQIIFAAGMIGIAIIAFLESQYAWRQGVNLPAGPKVMYGSVAGAVLLLMLSATFFFRQGTNLKQLDRIELPSHEHYLYIPNDHVVDVAVDFQHEGFTFHHSLDLEGNSFRLGKLTRSTAEYGYNLVHWPVASPQYNCWVDTPNVGSDGPDPQPPSNYYDLVLLSIYDSAVRHVIHLFESTLEQAKAHPLTNLYVKGNLVYVMAGNKVLTVDVADLDHAKVIRNMECPSGMTSYNWNLDDLTCLLPDIPELSDEERLVAALHFSVRRLFKDGMLCNTRGKEGDEIVAFRLLDQTAHTAHFHACASYKLTTFRKLLGGGDFLSFSIEDGLLFLTAHGGLGGPIIDVFELRGPNPLTPIGYFAASDADHVLPLADGRSIMSGDHTLYLVAAPKRAPGLEHP